MQIVITLEGPEAAYEAGIMFAALAAPAPVFTQEPLPSMPSGLATAEVRTCETSQPESEEPKKRRGRKPKPKPAPEPEADPAVVGTLGKELSEPDPAVEPTEAQTAAAVPASPMTLNELRTAFTTFVKEHNIGPATELLRKFGADRVGDLPPEKYATFYEALHNAG